jgi:hypothetical protein
VISEAQVLKKLFGGGKSPTFSCSGTPDGLHGFIIRHLQFKRQAPLSHHLPVEQFHRIRIDNTISLRENIFISHPLLLEI